MIPVQIPTPQALRRYRHTWPAGCFCALMTKLVLRHGRSRCCNATGHLCPAGCWHCDACDRVVPCTDGTDDFYWPPRLQRGYIAVDRNTAQFDESEDSPDGEPSLPPTE